MLICPGGPASGPSCGAGQGRREAGEVVAGVGVWGVEVGRGGGQVVVGEGGGREGEIQGERREVEAARRAGGAPGALGAVVPGVNLYLLLLPGPLLLPGLLQGSPVLRQGVRLGRMQRKL